MRALISKRLKIIGGDHTAKKTFRLPVCPSVFIKSDRKWKSIPIIIPVIILIIFFLTLSFFIDNMHPSKTIEIKING